VLAGWVVPPAALHGQQAIAAPMIAKQADQGLALQENHPPRDAAVHLYRDAAVHLFCEPAPATRFEARDDQTLLPRAKGQGRREARRYGLVTRPEGLAWPEERLAGGTPGLAGGTPGLGGPWPHRAGRGASKDPPPTGAWQIRVAGRSFRSRQG